MKRRSRMSTEITAYHEAGHAVVLLALHLPMASKGISIVPDEDSEGRAVLMLRGLKDCDPKKPFWRSRIEDLSIAAMAGDATARILRPKCRWGGHVDARLATDLLCRLTGGPGTVMNLRLRLARLEAEALVKLRWKQIEAVAAALIEHQRLTLDEVKQVMLDTTMMLAAGPARLLEGAK
jgi:hypothetical protein